jgi:hypothetical protein
MNKKNTKEHEEKVVDWIEQVTKHKASKGGDITSFKDGKTLCALVNAIKPGVAKTSPLDMPFGHRENIVAFLKAAKSIGVPEHELFDTNDLYESKNIGQVLLCLESLGRAAQKLNFNGPTIGVKLAEANIRTNLPKSNSNAIGLMEQKLMEMKPEKEVSFQNQVIKYKQEHHDGPALAPSSLKKK